MREWISVTFERFLEMQTGNDSYNAGDTLGSFDYVVVGSGYGGALTVRKLLDAKVEKVLWLERGKEYRPGDFAGSLGQLPGMVRITRARGDGAAGVPDALFNVHMGEAIDILTGSGFGGGSLINANVAMRPDFDLFRKPGWPSSIAEILDNEWCQHFCEAERLLHVDTIDANTLAKDSRFCALNALGKLPDRLFVAKPAPITVNLQGEEACTWCGNCATGCNVGAKRSVAHRLLADLDETLLDDADNHSPPLRVVTCANVLYLKQTQDDRQKDARERWEVVLGSTRMEGTALEGELYKVNACNVILCAGSLGSTEILKRSEKFSNLKLSPTLGSRFSTNGDGIAMGFGQSQRVGTCGDHNPFKPIKKPGPTITGVLQVEPYAGEINVDENLKNMRLTIENGAVPESLVHIFGEVATTAAQFGRLGNACQSAFFKNTDNDPLRVTVDSIEHSQLLLIMGDDGANGSLRWQQDAGDFHGKDLLSGHLTPVWEDVDRNPALLAADHYFKKLAEAGSKISPMPNPTGFDGGQYVPNPLWRIVPEKAAAAMGGSQPGGRVVTVHPLGGCPMGDDVLQGVVNQYGQVFRRDDAGQDIAGLYDGLFVLDGAIIPRAIGTNPFLTIAAIVLRAVDKMLHPIQRRQNCADSPTIGMPSPVKNRPKPPGDVNMIISEIMFGEVDGEEGMLTTLTSNERTRISQKQGLIIEIVAAPVKITSIVGDNRGVVSAEMRLYVNPHTVAEIAERRLMGVSREDLGKISPFLTLKGSISFFAKEHQELNYETLKNTVKALLEYRRRRMRIYDYLTENLFRNCFSFDGRNPLQEIEAFWRIAMQQAHYKKIVYAFSGNGISVGGAKTFGFGATNEVTGTRGRLWDVWTRIRFKFEANNKVAKKKCIADMIVDMDYLQAGMPLRVDNKPLSERDGLVGELQAVGGIMMFYFRNIFSSFFWEFGAPDYSRMTRKQILEPRCLNTADGIRVTPATTRLSVFLAGDSDQRIQIELTHYAAKKEKADAVLLIHGLAQGSLIFTAKGTQNLATSLWEEGYDVWLLDYRLSNRLLKRIPAGDWSFEEIARYDVAAAVKYIYESTHQQKVRIFAHCVGSVAISMAVLKGWVNHEHIHSLVLNAIHLWIEPSPVNRFRAFLGGVFRDALIMHDIDPLPSSMPGPMETLLDRIAFSLARLEEEREDVHSLRPKDVQVSAICDRMSAFYGRMWRHRNISEATHDDFLNLVGSAPASIYRHLYYLVLRSRITDKEGRNEFLTADNLNSHWKFPTLFLHGGDSQVFNPYSAKRSADNLCSILTAAQKIEYCIVPAYGHMDVIFGKHAHNRVFKKILFPFFR